MPGELVRIERDGALARLVLDRPERKNALHEPMWQALADRCGELASDPPRAVIVTGAGPLFSAGMDLYPDNPLTARLLPAVVGKDKAALRQLIVELKGIVHALSQLPCPTLAAVEGVCFGAGLEIALACDMRVVSRSARLALQETRFGMVPDLGGIVRLARTVGRSRATELILTTREMDAEEALRIGLADRIAEPGQAVAVASEIALRIAENAPTATRETLRVLRAVPELTDADAFDRETNAGVLTLSSGEVVQGVEAFAMKKKPVWS
jgi:enoyl-CoA hydratase/carnithine racemase